MIIYQKGSLGDRLMATVAVRAIKKAYPDEIIRMDQCSFPEVFFRNPDIGRGRRQQFGAMNLDLIGMGFGEHFSKTYERWLKIPVEDPDPKIYLTNQELAQGRVLAELVGIHRAKAGSLPIIAIEGWAGWPSKRWPFDRFVKLTERLKKWAFVVEVGVTFRGHDGKKNPRKVFASTSFKDKLEVRESAALLSQCDLLVGNDSGTGHLAAAVGLPQLTIFGRTDPRVFSHKNTFAFQPTKTCFKECEFYCKKPSEFCMLDLSVDDVEQAVWYAVESVRRDKRC